MGVVNALKCHKDVRPVSRITDLTKSCLADRRCQLSQVAGFKLSSSIVQCGDVGRAGWKKESEEGNK
jgi:hypothetical protein